MEEEDVSVHDVGREVLQATARLMVQGGYFDKIMSAGSELDRMKEYLRILVGERPAPPPVPGMAPTIFPPFPGLDERPWREPTMPAAQQLEQRFGDVMKDLERLESAELLHYDSVAVATGRWSVLPIFFGGERVDRLFWPEQFLDTTARIAESLDGQCTAFPMADVVISAHDPGTRLAPHCSWDGFRMRLHLGLRVPDGCKIRVGTEARPWQEGRVLAFHDSFEHETWNPTQERRVVLIVDCWHPGLTGPEREALLALTRKLEVRSMVTQLRIPLNMADKLLAHFAEVEKTDSLVHRYWRM